MIIGIDLGTTNSLACYFDEGEVKIIPNRLGENLTPSVVSIDEDDNIYVGKVAKERKILYPNMTAEVFKRSMGTDKEFALGDKKFKAEELSSFVLKSLKEDAEVFIGQEIEEAIISVPAYFNDEQRKATKKAGELAGLKVNRIINEPTAAAIAYGIDKRDDHTKFLVFDLGGGTFDISILEMYKNIMEVRAVAGDNYIGGEDFTDILYRMFIDQVKLDEDNVLIIDPGLGGLRPKKIMGLLKENNMNENNLYHFETKEEAIENLDNIIKDDDVILVKASRGMNLEKVVEYLNK